MPKRHQYLYGPVPSRRLGQSLGLDIVPLKVCTLDCIYCQVARTTNLTTRRKPYIPAGIIIQQLNERLKKPLQADFITLAGSGEPTLNSELGQIIRTIKSLTDIPIALLTNGTLFYSKKLRAECRAADVVLPSLDAADDETFRKINRPHPDISIKNLIDGLVAFRAEFTGQIWLEIFLLQGVNTSPDQLAKLKAAAEKINPEKIHLNTAVRPTAEPGLQKLQNPQLTAIADIFGPKAEVIPDFNTNHTQIKSLPTAKDVLAILKRRPCTIDDICAGLSINQAQANDHINYLKHHKLIRTTQNNAKTFFHAD